MAAALDDELDRLFGLPLGEFVSARNALARELKREGRADDAAAVSAFQKPTVPVWVANQLVRRRRREVDLLLDAGHRLRAAQAERDPERARAAFERARGAERDALATLTEAAAELLRAERGSASETLLTRTAAVLRLAAVDEDARGLLAQGRLTREPEPTGFELAAVLVPAARGGSRRRAGADDADRRAEARAALDEARAREREAKRELRDAGREVRRARQELEAAEARLERAQAAADAASAAVRAASEDVRGGGRRG